MTDALTARINQAAESLLDDETLTSALDDATAATLLEWGSAIAERIALQTSGMDDRAAESFMFPRLRACAKLMRQVNQWLGNAGEMDESDRSSSLGEIFQLAALIYPNFQPPSREQQHAFLQEPFPTEASEWILKLRTLVEGANGKAHSR